MKRFFSITKYKFFFETQNDFRIYTSSGNTETPQDLQFDLVRGGRTGLYYGTSLVAETTSGGLRVNSTSQYGLEVYGAWGTAETFSLRNTTSGGACMMGFQQQDTDGLHHRGYIKCWKNSDDGNYQGTLQLYTRGKNTGLRLSTGGNYARFEYHVQPWSNNTYDLGSSSLRWRNLYVNDLQLSNESQKDEGGNDVDGTWGDWTLQEGEENIYMINNRTGKKFKMNLTEVS